LIFDSETEARAATLQEEKMILDVSLREANQRIQQLESNQHGQQ
jgi:hypothetical protein